MDRGPFYMFWICFCLLTTSSVAHAEQHRYLQTTGDDSFEFLWELNPNRPYTITTAAENEWHHIEHDPDGSTRQWRFSDPHTQVLGVRVGNEIHLKGTLNGRHIDRRLTLKGLPWKQSLSYTLRLLLQSTEEKTTFWMIRQDQLKLLKLTARKITEESLAINGQVVRCKKVSITLTGLMAGLWQAHYWFRADDLVMLRYKGVNGPPGTPETRIELIE
jgi:hypothetical protein